MPARYIVRLWLTDREGNSRQVSFRPAAISSFESLLAAYITHMVPLVQAVSDAIVTRVDGVYTFIPDDIEYPTDGNVISDYALLFYTNDDDVYTRIAIPAAKNSIYESSGEYEGIRVDSDSVSAFSDHIADSEYFDASGLRIGPTYLVGGRAR